MVFCNENVTKQIDAFIGEHKQQIVNELMELVKIPSVQDVAEEGAPFGKGCKEVISAVKALCESHGLACKTEENNQYVMSYFGNTGHKQIGVFSHADVVPAEGEWLITKPFEPIVKDGYMFGRGCNDDKSAIVQAIYATEIIKQCHFPLKSDLMLFAGANEESGMADMATFCEKEKMPDVSLVPDGSYPFYAGEMSIIRFDIVSKHKPKTIKTFQGGKASNIVLGEVVVTLNDSLELWNELVPLCENNHNVTLERTADAILVAVKGKSNHVAKIRDSVNAAGVAAKLLLQCTYLGETDKALLQDIVAFIGNGDGAGFGITHSDEAFGALICGNGIVDITADGNLKMNFDVRCSPFVDTNALLETASQTAKTNWDLTVLRNSKGYLIDENASIPATIKNVYSYISGDTNLKAYKTSGGTYSRMLKNAYSIGNIAPYKTTPIELPDGYGGFHQPDEKLSIDGFLEGIKILVCMILEIDAALSA